jgi:RNA polymerase sigma-70 factor, ECF subfamily
MKFEAIWTEYYKRLYVFCTQSYGFSEEDTADLVQEILLKVYQKRDGYLEKYAFSTWVYTIARNSCIDFLRNSRSRLAHECADADNSEAVILQFPDGKHPAPEQELLDNELRCAIGRFIELLPTDDRELIYLRMYEEMPYREIAGITGKPEGTVKYRFFNIRKQLQTYLEDIYEREKTYN